MCRKRWIAKWLRSFGVITLSFVPTTSAVQAEALVFHASESGKQTLDQGEGGGNPLAIALIEILERPALTLSLLPATLRELTMQKSRRFQAADVPAYVPQGNFLLVPPKEGEHRIALVMAVSDYAQSGGAQSLPGAKHDA
jgi:hypothetical protein